MATRMETPVATLTVIATITAKADKIDLVKAELLKLITLSLAEPGCIKYDLHQDNNNPARFLFYENWQTRELWQEHVGSEHIRKFAIATEDAVDMFALNEMTQY